MVDKQAVQSIQKLGKGETRTYRKSTLWGERRNTSSIKILKREERHKDRYALRRGEGLIKNKSVMAPVPQFSSKAEVIC